MATKVRTKTIETETKIKKTNQVTTTTTTLQQNQESDRINKSKFETATSGLLNCYVNPLKELELKSKENA